MQSCKSKIKKLLYRSGILLPLCCLCWLNHPFLSYFTSFILLLYYVFYLYGAWFLWCCLSVIVKNFVIFICKKCYKSKRYLPSLSCKDKKQKTSSTLKPCTCVYERWGSIKLPLWMDLEPSVGPRCEQKHLKLSMCDWDHSGQILKPGVKRAVVTPLVLCSLTALLIHCWAVEVIHCKLQWNNQKLGFCFCIESTVWKPHIIA